MSASVTGTAEAPSARMLGKAAARVPRKIRSFWGAEEVCGMSIRMMVLPRMMHDEVRLVTTCLNGETIRVRRVTIGWIAVGLVSRSNAPA